MDTIYKVHVSTLHRAQCVFGLALCQHTSLCDCSGQVRVGGGSGGPSWLSHRGECAIRMGGPRPAHHGAGLPGWEWEGGGRGGGVLPRLRADLQSQVIQMGDSGPPVALVVFVARLLRRQPPESRVVCETLVLAFSMVT